MVVQFLGHAAFRLGTDSGLNLYFDPWKLSDGPPQADVILVSHDHYDHCSHEDIVKLRGEDTVIVGPSPVQQALAKNGLGVEVVNPGESAELGGLRIRAVAAYNTNKFRSPGVPFHPQSSGYAGFVVEDNGFRIYHAGDTDIIPEDVERDGSIDLAFVPVSGRYVMTASEAAEQIGNRPFRYVVPMHYGAIVGSREDAEAFRDSVKTHVVILAEDQTTNWPPGE